MNVVRFFRVVMLTVAVASITMQSTKAQIINLDLSNLNPFTTDATVFQAFQEAEQFWESFWVTATRSQVIFNPI
jgi:hypothetical protein